MTSLFAVDVGGTFTDVVVLSEGRLSGRKVPTTADQSEAVLAAAGGTEEDFFFHGTTSATNTLLEGNGARVALVTSPGFEDLIEIARQDRPSLYDSSADRPSPLVEREDRLPSDLGERLLPSVDDSLGEVVAVALLDSHVDPGAEREIGRLLRSGQTRPVVLASDVSPEFREYERIATTVLSAHLTPSVADYLASLDEVLPMRRRLVMTSAGGLIPFAQASRLAGRLVLSGPAGGAVAAAALGRHHGHQHVLSFDMGGTSTDVCRISGGELAVAPGHTVAGRVNRVPSLPVKTIGAGGGSVGWVDAGGALRVGPRSAGAIPGPAAYGLGGDEPTVTDANLVTGRIPESLALGGSVTLSEPAALEALSGLGARLGLGAKETAHGMLEVADSHMEHALRSVSVEEGADPREAVLVAFGGAGGLHASRLARRLGMSTVMVPPLSGVFSALGLLLATPRADVARTVMLAEGDSRYAKMASEIAADALERYRDTFTATPDDVSRSCDIRYVGQSHELEVDGAGGWEDLRRRFEAAHLARFGFDRVDEPVEVVNIRGVATGAAPLAWADVRPDPPGGSPVMHDGVWERESLPAGLAIDGPALVTETNSVTLVGEGDRLTVLEDGTLEMTLR